MKHNMEKQILLVEDNDNDAELTVSALTEFNIANEIHRVEDGEEALNYLYYRDSYQTRQKVNPAVVLLDLKMPKVSGLEVLREIRSDDNLRNMPVVILTSSQEEQDLVRSYSLGVNAYVVKPVDFEQFAKAIKDLGIFWLVVNTPPPVV